MVPLFQFFSLVWLSVTACCCAVVARRLQTWFSGRRSGRLLHGVGRQAIRVRARSENAARVECLAKNTRNLDDFHENGAARVECLAKKPSGFFVWSWWYRFWFPAMRSVTTCMNEGDANRFDNEPATSTLNIDTALVTSAWILLSVFCGLAPAAEPTRAEVIATMKAYDGPTANGVDRTTLTGKVMAGYQGWFTAEGDASGQGWRHYSLKGDFRPGRCSIDLWPDVSELDADEKYPTRFRHADGSTAFVFSSQQRKTVLRHFRWMQEYGIDGVFVQRFVVATGPVRDLIHCNSVLAHCREGANQHGRCYAVMYDLSGVPAGGVQKAIDDWKLLVDRMRLGRDEKDLAYLRHNGKPVVAVWGIGFNDGRTYTLQECDRLLEFLKNDPKYGGNAVMLGIPTYWRTLDRDSIVDPALHATLLKGDILSPWTVGRYNSLQAIERHSGERWQPDMDWCRKHGKEYLPVVFPGFSWHNMRAESPLNMIPRLKGEFLWQQYVAAKKTGATMIYQAMFDEMDEATAIFKCTNNPPVGESPFVTYEGLPSDHYLWLTGMGGKLLRGEIQPTEKQPARMR
jgi:hypothetical protein